MALQDKIGREEIVDKICGLVGSLKKDKNFCLAINGAWGSGKSFVLSMIEGKLSQKFEYIVIKYDAWENSFYNEPLIAILSCIKIFENQRNEFNKLKKISQYERNHSMPFYDYILEFLGVNRLDQPADISRFCQFGCGQFAEESWKFNEIIFYSMGTQFFADEISDFYSPLDGNPKEYEKLRRLVIFYGGEQEKCEK